MKPSPINPYAPVSAFTDLRQPKQVAQEQRIEFRGHLDVAAVRKTDSVTLSCGMVIGLGFAGVLLGGAVSALSSGGIGMAAARFAAIILATGAGVTILALFAFIRGERHRPLKDYPWMNGPIQGVIDRSRIDMIWQHAEASLLFSGLVSNREYCHHAGRMFECRGVLCFVPADSVEPGVWPELRSMVRQLDRDAQLAQPPPPDADAIGVFEPTDSFQRDLRKHHFVCKSPGFSRIVCLLTAAMLVMSAAFGPSDLTMVSAILVFLSGMFWALREGTRRGWRGIRYRRWLFAPLVAGAPPPYTRWVGNQRMLVGFSDGWICVPWMAIRRAIISPHAIEFRLSREGGDAWFLERGSHRDEQWREIGDHVRGRVRRTETWGAHLA